MSPRTRRKRTAADRQRFAPIFAALGDETRLALIATLADGTPRSIAQLTEGTRLTRQAVTKHLRVLEDVRIVHSVKSGRESRYELDVTPLLDLKSYVELVSARWDTALGRLKALVER